jgi:FkbM family methyltransferase
MRQWLYGKAIGLRALAEIAPNLREPLRFSLRQITRRRGVRSYRLRGSDVRIFVRHSTGDLTTLHEVLAERQYEPPPTLADGAPTCVADLGANIGLFSAWVMSRYPGARIVAFEPDPGNALVLEACIAANGNRAEVIRAAATPSDGELHFQAGALAASRQVDDGGIVVRAVDAFPYLRDADFVKIDIEGGEWALLADPRFASLSASRVVVEYHPHLCPAADPRTHAETLLTDAGWKLQHMDFDMPAGHGVIWAWR